MTRLPGVSLPSHEATAGALVKCCSAMFLPWIGIEIGVAILQCHGCSLALGCSNSMFYPVRVRTVKK